ncbi:MAG TPA: hypothetical protein VMS32_01740, partial [Verrucomicrobiae bacterium]|nr:hypothetical protein [Verrucomicrobiae bacterium]
MIVAIFTFALLASPAPTATASPAAVTIQGVVLGETAMAMVAARGEPLGVSDNQGGKDYLYPASADNGLVFARVVNGNVVGVGVEPPPWSARALDDSAPIPNALGVALGDTMAAVAKLPKEEFVSASQGADGNVSAIYRGMDGLNYTFRADKSGKIVWILAQLPPAAVSALAASPDPTLHGGTSIADA